MRPSYVACAGCVKNLQNQTVATLLFIGSLVIVRKETQGLGSIELIGSVISIVELSPLLLLIKPLHFPTIISRTVGGCNKAEKCLNTLEIIICLLIGP